MLPSLPKSATDMVSIKNEKMRINDNNITFDCEQPTNTAGDDELHNYHQYITTTTPIN